MFDTVAARRMMVDGQIRTADVTDLDLIGAMLAVPRERFVPAAVAAQAYVDTDLPLGEGRALLKPMVLAKLIQALRIRSTDHVLDVACATGYSSAVLARLAGSVVALEQSEALAGQARQSFATAEDNIVGANIVGALGPLSAGWLGAAPYDVILLNGATEVVPEALGRQLKPDGRLACVFGRGSMGKAMIYRLIEGQLAGRPIFDAAAALLPGFEAIPAFVF
jgi:protein-L-isoaspartate(D-aspartate) O-methyltransferase